MPYGCLWDGVAIEALPLEGLSTIVTAGFSLLGMIYVTVRLDAQLALVALAVSPLLFFVSHSFRGRFRQQWKDLKRLDSSARAIVEEVLSAIRVVKAFGRENYEG